MRKSLYIASVLTLVAPDVARAAAELAITSDLRRFAETPEDDYRSVGAAFSVSGARYGAWGNASRMSTESRSSAGYGEIAGLGRLTSALHVTAGVGGGDLPRLKPARIVLGDVYATFPSLSGTLGAGASRETYVDDAATVRNAYDYARLSWQQALSESAQLRLTAQRLVRSRSDTLTLKRGYSAAIAATHVRTGGSEELGVLRSCLGDEWSCTGGALETYLEGFVKLRQRATASLAVTLHLTRTLARAEGAATRSTLVALGVVRAI